MLHCNRRRTTKRQQKLCTRNLLEFNLVYGLIRKDDIFDRLQGSEWFSELDLNSAFWFLAIADTDIEKTALSTPDGHYEFLRMPFGVTNGTHAFQRLMFIVFGDFSTFVQTYLDNLIFG